MYLVPRIYNEIEISYEGEPSVLEETITSDNKVDVSLEKTLSPQLLLLLQKHRAEKKEAERLAKEAENARAFEEGEAQLRALMEKIDATLRATKKRKCSYQYLQETVAVLHNSYLQVKGLNESGAGRKCQ